MNLESKSGGAWRGFSAPLGADGRFALYGPPPWKFEGYAASVSLRLDLRGLVPPPLEVAEDPVVRLTVLDFVCDCGHGESFAQMHPDLAQQTEAVVGIAVTLDGEPGYWPALLWCSSDAEMAVGREMYGWAQRRGSVSLTREPRRGWRDGDVATALVRRGDRAVFAFTVSLRGTVGDGPASSDPATMTSHIGRLPIFTQTALADPMHPGMVERRMVATDIENVKSGPVWHGPAELDISSPELAFLRGAEVVEGRWHRQSWTKPYAARVVSTVAELG